MEILSGLNSGAKMVLKITLEGTSSVKMKLVSINKKFVKKHQSNDFNFFLDEENEFVIWSTQDFVFNNRQLRIPDEKHIVENMFHVHEFKNDMDRYDSLKKMHLALQKWSDEMDLKDVFAKSYNDKKVIITGDYWFVA